MSSPIRSFLHDSKEYLKTLFINPYPLSKKERKQLWMKQGIYALGTIATGFNPIMIMNHAIGYLSSIYKTKIHDAHYLASYYRSPPPNTSPVDKPSLAISTGLTCAVVGNFVYTVDWSQYSSFEDIVTLTMFGAFVVDVTQGMYFTLSRAKKFTSTTDDSFIKSIWPYISGNKDFSKGTKLSHAMKLLRDNPEKGLQNIIKMRYDEKMSPHTYAHEVPESFMLTYYGTNALSSFVSSLICIPMEKYKQGFFERAVESAIERNNLSELALLGLYAKKECDDNSVLEQQINLLFNTSHLRKIILNDGSFTNAMTFSQSNKPDTTSMTLVQKYSVDKKRLKDKYSIHSSGASPHLHEILHLSDQDDFAVTTELRIRKPSFGELIKEQPHLWDKGYTAMGNIQDSLENIAIHFKPICLIEKYLTNPLLEDSSYYSLVERTQKSHDILGEEKILLDFHEKNLFVSDDFLIHVDIENKGRGSKLIDIVKFLHYSHHLVSHKTLLNQKDIFLNYYQEERNIDTSFLEQVYLETLGTQLFSYAQARRKPQGFVQRNQILSLVDHCSQVFSSYLDNSSQKNLARLELEVAQMIRNTV